MLKLIVKNEDATPKIRASITVVKGDLHYIKDEDMHEYKIMVKSPNDGTWAHGQHVSIENIVILLEYSMKCGKSMEDILKAMVELCDVENLELLRYIKDLKMLDKILSNQRIEKAHLKIQCREKDSRIKEQNTEIDSYTDRLSWYEQILGQMGASQLLGEGPSEYEDEDEDEE